MDNIEGYMSLAAAVVETAAKDYERAIKRLTKRPLDHEAKRTINECERFFRRDVGKYMLADIDGEAIIKAIRERAKNEGKIRRGRIQLKEPNRG